MATDMRINKRLKRAVDYNAAEKEGVPQAALFTFDDPTDEQYTYVGHVSRQEAHRWMHGNESIFEGDKTAPSVDVMLDAIAAKLKADMAMIMEYCATEEGWLYDMYQRSKEARLSVTPTQR